jgi:hypothetical protein
MIPIYGVNGIRKGAKNDAIRNIKISYCSIKLKFVQKPKPTYFYSLAS